MNYFNYFSEIEETFNKRRGKYLFLSPLDWTLIESWQEKGVPLHIVLRGIEKVFDGYDAKAGKRRAVKSISYCREEIEAQYEEWLERQTGKNTDETASSPETSELFAENAVSEHLRRVSAELKAATLEANDDLRETLNRVVERLEKLTETNAEILEDSLGELEKLIDDALIETANPAQLAELNQQIEKNLVSYKGKMEKDVYRRTFELMILKTLRERAAIPRLSLFYL